MNADRYLKIVFWARDRYRTGGLIIQSYGGKPSRYSVIEDMAGAKYMGFARRYPDYGLNSVAR